MSPVTRGRHDLWGGLLLAIGAVLVTTAIVGVSLFQIGAAAFFVWLALARNQGWAWIPAAIFGFQVAGDLFDGVGGSLTFPLLVIAGGVLMLSRGRLNKQATIGILVLLAVVGIASNNGDRNDRKLIDRPQAAASTPAPPDEADLIDLNLDGRDLLVISREADISLRRSTTRDARMSPHEAGVINDEDSEEVIVDAGDSDKPIELWVPAETDVVVRTVSADVSADLSGVALDVDTISGDLDIDLVGAHAVTAETTSGDIEVEGIEDFDNSPNFLASEAVGSRVRLKSRAGTISISQT